MSADAPTGPPVQHGRHWVACTLIGGLLLLAVVGVGAAILWGARTLERSAREKLVAEGLLPEATPAVEVGASLGADAGEEPIPTDALDEPTPAGEETAEPPSLPVEADETPVARTARGPVSKVSPKEPGARAANASPSEPQRVGGDVLAPERISSVQPVYPEMARKARLQGVVIVEAVIDEEGRVGSVRVLKSLPMGLDQAAVDAVEQWRFRPATLYGQAVPVYFILTVNFRLE